MAFVRAFLTCVSGPLGRSTFAFDNEVTFGRNPDNRICIHDPALSRHHCAITCDGGNYVVRDLNSHNGTFLNGSRVTQQDLTNGDHIRIGDSVFQFVVPDGPTPAAADISLDDTSVGASTFFTIPAERPFEAELPMERLAHDFGALLMIATRLRGIRSSESLLWQLTGVLFEVLPADRIAIFLGADPDTLHPAFGWDKESGPGRAVCVSRTVLRRVISEQTPLLVNNVPEHLRVSSMKALEVFSVVCAPISSPEKPLGVIYADTRQIGSMFDTGHLHLLSAIATIAALSLENVRSLEVLEHEFRQLKAEIRSHFDIVGDSAPMNQIYRFIAKVAQTDSNVMIYGESGTGKELVARAIHRASARENKPFVAINCAAITESLLESELFGYEKGAFTGATTQKRGYLETADGGTIFLDEIGELALSLQAKMLRVLQEREIIRVGGTRPLKVDVRILAATNKPLAELVKEGRFREDLFYRLDVVSCTIPALRQRREDVSVLARHFAQRHAAKCKRQLTGISDDALACLMQYDWPGNVRELENAIERAVVLGSTPVILRDDLPESLQELEVPQQASNGYHAEIARRKRELILQALQRSNNSFTEAAKLLGIHPNYLHRLVRILNLRAELRKASNF